MPTLTRLSFVWNADFSFASGLRALKEAVDGQHSCTLCAIAYHRVRQTSDWKQYKRALATRYGVDIREPCRNQLDADQLAAAAGDFPCVLATGDAGTRKLLGAADIDACNGCIGAFRERLQQALDAGAGAASD